MEEHNFRPCGFRNCYRSKHSFSLCSFSKVTTGDKNSSGVISTFRAGSPKLVGERGNMRSPVLRRRFLQSVICNPKKGRKHASSYRPESSKSLHRHTAFSNGELGYSKVSFQARSLHDQDRSQGRILFGSYSPSESEIPEIPVAKQSIPVLFSSVRSEHCTVSVYSPHETSSRFPEETGCSPNLLPGRYAHNWFDPSRSQRLYPDGCESPKSAGVIINLDKSVLTPTQVITFLGFTINSITMRFTLPSEKVQKLLTLCRQLRSSSKVLLRTLAQLLGLLESYRLAVWQAPLHFRYLQALLIRGLNQINHNYEAPVSLSSQSLGEINWWLQNLETVNGSPIITPSSDLTIFTDASLTGWGAACGNIQTNGKWSATERQLHINVLELKGAMLGIQSLLKNQTSKIISLNMDSSTAVAYINHKGSTHSPELLQVALQLWNWCIQRNLFIIAYHVPGKTNVVADRESREFIGNSDWKVDPIIISPFLRGCSTDLFASRLTHQLARYISWRPDPQAFKADAFSVNWKHLKGYAFPPFNLIARVLDKMMMDKTDLVLVAPIWQAQPWWPLLLGMLVQQPVLLPSSSTLLIDPTDPQHIHPMFPRLHLGVFHISSNDIRQRAFRETLPNYSSQQLEIPHRKHTSPAGNAGAAGVIRGKLILFQHL